MYGPFFFLSLLPRLCRFKEGKISVTFVMAGVLGIAFSLSSFFLATSFSFRWFSLASSCSLSSLSWSDFASACAASWSALACSLVACMSSSLFCSISSIFSLKASSRFSLASWAFFSAALSSAIDNWKAFIDCCMLSIICRRSLVDSALVAVGVDVAVSSSCCDSSISELVGCWRRGLRVASLSDVRLSSSPREVDPLLLLACFLLARVE